MKKVKSHLPIEEEQEPDIAEALSENPTIQWIVENRTTLAYLFVGLIAAFLLITRWSNGGIARAEADYIKAENDFRTFQRGALDLDGEESAESSLNQLKNLLNDYPELHAKYDGPIAQTLIAVNEANEGQSFAERTLKRTQSNSLPDYIQFSETTLLIFNQDYSNALIHALQLKNKISDQDNILYAYNLIRIAMLYQIIGNKEEEAKAWEEFKTHATQFSTSNLAYRQLLESFEAGNTSIFNYIEARLNTLNVAS